jgi:hypothetical protein
MKADCSLVGEYFLSCSPIRNFYACFKKRVIGGGRASHESRKHKAFRDIRRLSGDGRQWKSGGITEIKTPAKAGVDWSLDEAVNIST